MVLENLTSFRLDISTKVFALHPLTQKILAQCEGCQEDICDTAIACLEGLDGDVIVALGLAG